MSKTFKVLECPPECGFLARSHVEEELIDLGLAHGKKYHGLNATREEARGWLRVVAAPRA